MISSVTINYGGKTEENLKADASYKLWEAAAKATLYTRNLANTRASIAKPDYMEKAVRDLVGDRSDVTITVVKGKELSDLGMNLFYAVGKGANVEPRCVVANYKGNPASDIIDIAFVGKGITFDTGGLNIKPTGGMEPMFLDKHGACSVIGALHGTLELGLKKNIVFAMGFAENSVDANSYIPSDIITSLKGLTV